MKKITTIICLSLIVISVSFAQRDREAIREKINAHRAAFITEQLSFSTTEAQAFWPVFNEYKEKEKEIKKDRRNHPKLEEMTDAEIEQFIEMELDQEAALLALKRNFITQIKAILPIQKVAKLSHTERKFKEWMFAQVKKDRKGSKDK